MKYQKLSQIIHLCTTDGFFYRTQTSCYDLKQPSHHLALVELYTDAVPTVEKLIDIVPLFFSESMDVAVIREIYDGENAQELFEIELERALQAGCHTIVIEPGLLGDETGRWIKVGNFLHKSSILSGFCAIVTGKKIPSPCHAR